MHRLQVYIPDELLNKLRLLAKEEGVSVAEVLRRSGWIYREKKVKKTSNDPYGKLFEMRGTVMVGPNMSTTGDAIYDEQND